MKKGYCPKCNSSNIFKQVGGIRFGPGGGDATLTIFSGDLNHLTRNIHYDSYICVDCGYFENYIVDQAPLQEIPKKWSKVT